MAGFIRDAEDGDVMGACRRAGISYGEYRRARMIDAAFGISCARVDQGVQLAIVAALESKAATGDIRAAALLMKGLGQLAGDDRPDDGRVITAELWAAGIAPLYPRATPGNRALFACEPDAPQILGDVIDQAYDHAAELLRAGTPADLVMAEVLAGYRCPCCRSLQSVYHPSSAAYSADVLAAMRAGRVIDLGPAEPPRPDARGLTPELAAALDSVKAAAETDPLTVAPWHCAACGHVGGHGDEVPGCRKCASTEGCRKPTLGRS